MDAADIKYYMLISVKHCRIEAVAEPNQADVLGCRSLKILYLLFV